MTCSASTGWPAGAGSRCLRPGKSGRVPGEPREGGRFLGIPQDLDGFLKLCQALKAKGTLPGFALGHATGDANVCAIG